MSHAQPAAKLEREKKLKAVLTFASTLSERIETGNNDATLISELQTQMRGLPLQASSTLTAKQDELDKLGTELWNQATRLRRKDESDIDAKSEDATAHKFHILPFLRAYAFMLLDSAGGRGPKGRQRKNCIRLIKVALKTARVCIEGNELGIATKVLERAADYEDVLGKRDEGGDERDGELADGFRAQYFAVRTTLAWRSGRMDMAEHMFRKCKEFGKSFNATTTEQLADLLYEIGKAALAKRDYEIAARWLERAFDVLGEQDLDMLSPEIGELRLSIMQSLVNAYMKTKTMETQEKAWQMMRLMETDFGDKMMVSLLKIELLSEAQTFDTTEFYNVLLRMIRTVVLNDTNFKTIMHYIHKLKDHSNTTACKALEDLIDVRLFREENQSWIEKAVITRIWIGTNNNLADNTLEQLQELFDTVDQNSKIRLSAPATHAAQTLLWKKAQSAGNKRQAIRALEKVLEKYEHNALAEINLPALLRSATRMLESELIKDGKIDTGVLRQICNVFEGACLQAKASRTRPSTPAKELFTAVEFEWFSKNAYNISLKYCAEMPPGSLVRLLSCCIEFIKLLKGKTQPEADGDLCLRLVFCEFLAACTYTTLARAEDNTEQSIHYYLETRKHSQEFRQAAAEGIDKLSGPSQADIISKHLQVVKLELEAVLKLQRWDELDKLFDQCWKYKSPDHYETLADLVLVIHGCILKAGVDKKYQTKVLSVLEKIINLTCRQPNRDITKLARWLRCLFNISLEHDEKASLKCIEQVTHMAAKQQNTVHSITAKVGLHTPSLSSDPAKNADAADPADDYIKELERYPKTELEWLACTLFNRAVDYYLQENDDATRKWADQAFLVAQCIDDGGATRNNLMSRFARLEFGE
ncbi:hypothetical protein J4E82_005842 [Alternaria postmessia]|uniref:uncharacterized protein n=1 Tax=Alternaria postmessia TaxID=1187938 RepID=UPI002224FD5F|nr:uncharacterized protein J4E82_005842 [Alternaria postmessia]KAI5375420.1 hypothetical protein J4E82_005842 [Alternaria postmessia]